MATHSQEVHRLDLQPRLHTGVYVYCCVPSDAARPDEAVCIVREQEGITLILPETVAEQLGLAYGFRAAWITLDTPTALSAVGITAAISKVLADAGISCNMVAGFHHDHLFVAYERGEEAARLIAGL